MLGLDPIRANLTVVTAWHRPFYVMALPRPDRGIDRATCINAMSIEVARSSRAMTIRAIAFGIWQPIVMVMPALAKAGGTP